ncbi:MULTISPECIES: AIR synthase family protein [Haloferax]|uniref:Hydrogenase expression/formation protein HypE n=1 Tax=Haloferax massiliensis TaxID=1476858 RepID=A0A0D6JWA6_9EURY|nr:MULTISPECIES: AIR synthase family protein [Haloferax]MDS0242467.1 AIR synthase family protein [Haloferax sp. S2CR25]MDS0445588.1 AIR synthase family protein [Haloferax sp. S2CR25-2]CQR52871.1 Hydrogenase expression/formation protein HypE [Haloferax massiliensis]
MSKLSPADLDRYVFSRTGAPNDDLLVGAGYGEDAAAVATGEGTMVVSTDPISLAAERIGTLGVAIASNDVAACGGVPEWLVSTVLLPEPDVDLLDDITAQLDAEARRLGISIVGGHTETVAGLSRPLLSLTCMGPTDRYVPTSGADPGDAVILTKGAGIEGTAVLATDFRADLDAAGVDSETVDRAADFFDDISVLPESAVLAPAATAMHDPTEGGVLNGLVELACASGVRIEVDGDDVPVRPETRALCDAMGVDPMRILGSGALLAAVPEDEADGVLAALDAEGIEATVVGTVEAAGDGTNADDGADSTASAAGVVYDGVHHADGVEDDMYDLWN